MNAIARAALLTVATLIGSANGQAVVHQGESIFVIAIRRSPGTTFRGSYLAVTADGESKTNRIAGMIPAEFTVVATHMFLTVEKLTEGGEMEVEISKNGTAIKRQSTNAPFGVVGLATAMPEGGVPQQTEFQVTGSAKYAFLTISSGTGETRQEQVELPYKQEFFPRVGWIVGLTAQKRRVTRIDPLSLHAKVELLDDGVSGSLHVAIKVNGRTLSEEETSQPFGVASATARLP
jgi:hypothetical protein